MKIKLMRNSYYMAGTCATCHESFMRDTVVPVLVDDTEAMIGEICERCFQATPEELRTQIRRQANHLRRLAADLDRIEAEPVQRPSAATVQAVAHTPSDSTTLDNYIVQLWHQGMRRGLAI